MVVQHNLTAMNSNRMLGLTQSSQAKSTEKLSSGYKINRAADDAAGLSISEKMRKQIRGLTQASLNAEDGISAVQTAEGALNEVQDMLQRMNELAVKAANGTMSEDDRNYIQDEVDQLKTEINRVAETTKFNETYLLKGDTEGDKATKFAYKTGKVTSQDLYYINDDGSISSLAKGTYSAAVDSDVQYFSTSEKEPVGAAIASSSDYFAAASMISESGLYSVSGSDYVLVNKGEEYSNTATYYKITFNNNGEVGSAASVAAPGTSNAYKLTASAYDKYGTSVASGAVVSATTGYYSATYGAKLATADSVDLDYADSIAQFTDKDGNEIAANGLYRYIEEDGTLKADSGLYIGGQEAKQGDVDALVDSSQKFTTGSLSLKLHVGADATGNNQITIDLQAMDAVRLGIDSVDVSGADDEGALNAIETVKEAIQMISTQRSALGAVQNRLEHTIANLDNVVENTTAAESQIRDTDMATEMVKYSNNNILAQAGQAMLAQANQANQGVLSLLG